MESGRGRFLGGLESTPKEVLQNFLGCQLLRGVKPPDPPSNTALLNRLTERILWLQFTPLYIAYRLQLFHIYGYIADLNCKHFIANEDDNDPLNWQ